MVIAAGSIYMIGELKSYLATTAESNNLSQRLETTDGSF
jgi:hypothetical protein